MTNDIKKMDDIISSTMDIKRPSLIKRLFTINETVTENKVYLTPKIDVYVNGESQPDIKVEIKDAGLEEKIDSLAEYRLSKEPFYLTQNGESKLFQTAFEQKLPFMLKGPTGCGKTRFVEHMAYHLGKPLITVSCQEDLSASDLTGRIMLNQRGTYWQDGPLALAARYGGLCYLDEVVEARNDVMVLIHSLTDHRRILPIDKTGEVIKAHDDFMLVVSYNPNYQSALKGMKESTRQRFLALDFDYPSRELEIDVVKKESYISHSDAAKLVDFGRCLRQMKDKGLKEGASTRLLIYAGQLMHSGVDQYTAIKSAIASPLTDEPDIYKSIMDLAKAKW